MKEALYRGLGHAKEIVQIEQVTQCMVQRTYMLACSLTLAIEGGWRPCCQLTLEFYFALFSLLCTSAQYCVVLQVAPEY